MSQPANPYTLCTSSCFEETGLWCPSRPSPAPGSTDHIPFALCLGWPQTPGQLLQGLFSLPSLVPAGAWPPCFCAHSGLADSLRCRPRGSHWLHPSHGAGLLSRACHPPRSCEHLWGGSGLQVWPRAAPLQRCVKCCHRACPLGTLGVQAPRCASGSWDCRESPLQAHLPIKHHQHRDGNFSPCPQRAHSWGENHTCAVTSSIHHLLDKVVSAFLLFLLFTHFILIKTL